LEKNSNFRSSRWFLTPTTTRTPILTTSQSLMDRPFLQNGKNQHNRSINYS
jgi:hypothetical protein